MATPSFTVPLFAADAAGLLIGRDVPAAMLAGIEQARHRVWVSMFITSMAHGTDRHGRVRELVDAFARAARRGVDARLLIDHFTSQVDDFAVNLIAAHYLLERGVPVRVYRSERHVSLHSKYLLIDDDRIVLGSGNWSPGAISHNLEAALSVCSHDMTHRLAERFERDWGDAATPEPLP